MDWRYAMTKGGSVVLQSLGQWTLGLVRWSTALVLWPVLWTYRLSAKTFWIALYPVLVIARAVFWTGEWCWETALLFKIVFNFLAPAVCVGLISAIVIQLSASIIYRAIRIHPNQSPNPWILPSAPLPPQPTASSKARTAVQSSRSRTARPSSSMSASDLLASSSSRGSSTSSSPCGLTPVYTSDSEIAWAPTDLNDASSHRHAMLVARRRKESLARTAAWARSSASSNGSGSDSGVVLLRSSKPGSTGGGGESTNRWDAKEKGRISSGTGYGMGGSGRGRIGAATQGRRGARGGGKSMGGAAGWMRDLLGQTIHEESSESDLM